MAESFPDFEIQEIQELKEKSEKQNAEKSASTWLNFWTSWAEKKKFETNLLAYEAKQIVISNLIPKLEPEEVTVIDIGKTRRQRTFIFIPFSQGP